MYKSIRRLGGRDTFLQLERSPTFLYGCQTWYPKPNREKKVTSFDSKMLMAPSNREHHMDVTSFQTKNSESEPSSERHVSNTM